MFDSCCHPSPLDFPEGVDKAAEAVNETKEMAKEANEKSDKEINSKNKTDAKGKQSDSITVTFVKKFDPVEGNTVQDFRIHENSRHGRPISKPYKEKK
jgi:Sec-independent protein translocase protein TatA